ncbi:uncharacterized protein YdaU (DUF1376 family) [Inhella inkyongensis]|uniref:Uncharacterized protein YdaU (DUF1376 family) n=1 Tax=Inhella inkyongensis TaxID=392593 RepID=A0A840RYU8_9BURK|nr:hypothetical protein [Inhella inkyongensis]MBB5203937.1 uncharacterized protein YdaU (DUF1376 family) [Inhella inkyongensis]
MAQHRDAPAFQEYAASMMARTGYRAMSLQGRGLLYTLRLECWVNGFMPAEPSLLARVLGYTHEEVAGVLAEVRPFFLEQDGQLRCPELDDYRAHLNDKRERQSKGGRAGAQATNSARSQRKQAGSSTGKPRVGRGSLVQVSPEQPSTEKVNSALSEDSSMEDWAREYERASRGY